MESNMKKWLEEEGTTHRAAVATISPVFKTAARLDDFHW